MQESCSQAVERDLTATALMLSDAQTSVLLVALDILFIQSPHVERIRARVAGAAGLPVGPGSVIDALNALQAIEIGKRADVYTTLEAIFVKRHEHMLIFAQAFDLFFKARGASGLDMPLFSLGERARVVTRRDAGAPQRLDVEDAASAAAEAAFADIEAVAAEAAREMVARLAGLPVSANEAAKAVKTVMARG